MVTGVLMLLVLPGAQGADLPRGQISGDIKTLEAQLSVDETRTAALADLRRRWQDLATQASQPDDSPERRFARRVLDRLSAAVTTWGPSLQPTA